LASKAIEFGEEKTQNKGCYAVQGHSRLSRSVSIESLPVYDFLSSYLVLFRSYRSLLFTFWTLCVFEPL